MRIMLGDYLFEAMKASNLGKLVFTGAVDVAFPSGKDSSGDSKLEVMLNFETGHCVYTEAYPRY